MEVRKALAALFAARRAKGPDVVLQLMLRGYRSESSGPLR
jgi:hypothetical protein